MRTRFGFALAALAITLPAAAYATTTCVGVDAAQEIVRGDGQSRAVLKVWRSGPLGSHGDPSSGRHSGTSGNPAGRSAAPPGGCL